MKRCRHHDGSKQRERSLCLLCGWFDMHVVTKAEFSFLQREPAFCCFFKHVPNWCLVCPIYTCLQSFQGMEQPESVRCSPVTWSLGAAKTYPSVWKGFWAFLTLWLAKILFNASNLVMHPRSLGSYLENFWQSGLKYYKEMHGKVSIIWKYSD